MSDLSFPMVGSIVPGPADLGDVRLDAVLGSGAFGIVFKASAVRGSGTVAVKFLQAGLLADPHERQALFNEVISAQAVQNDNVIRVLAENLDADRYPPYLISEYADGGTLQDRLNEGSATDTMVSVEVVADWSSQLVSGMRAINAHVLHRDLKPDNILFSGGILKVADFGLAKLVGAATRTVMFKGGQHVLYMAPESWEGQRNDVQIDMWVYPGFPTLFWGLSGFFVNDLMGKALWSSWKTRSVFQGAVGAFCASTAPSASTGPICMRQDRRVLGLQSTRE